MSFMHVPRFTPAIHASLLSGLVCILSCCNVPAAGQDLLQSVLDHSTLEFVARYENTELQGRFKSFRAEFSIDPLSGSPQHMKVTVNTASADMNDREINDELVQEPWFDTGLFTEAVFESERIRHDANGSFIASGELFIKGISASLDVPFDWTLEGDRVQVTGQLSLSRLDWNIGSGEWADDNVIADQVQVRFTVTLLAVD